MAYTGNTHSAQKMAREFSSFVRFDQFRMLNEANNRTSSRTIRQHVRWEAVISSSSVFELW